MTNSLAHHTVGDAERSAKTRSEKGEGSLVTRLKIVGLALPDVARVDRVTGGADLVWEK